MTKWVQVVSMPLSGPQPRPVAFTSSWRPGRRRLGAALAYGAAVGAVAGLGMLHPGHPDGRLIVVAAFGCAPALLAVVPLFCVLGGMAWNLAGGEAPPDGVTAWPVTLTYAAIFALAAFLNALFWAGTVVAGSRWVRQWVRGRRG